MRPCSDAVRMREESTRPSCSPRRHNPHPELVDCGHGAADALVTAAQRVVGHRDGEDACGCVYAGADGGESLGCDDCLGTAWGEEEGNGATEGAKERT